MYRAILPALALILTLGCSGPAEQGRVTHERLHGVLWMQTSAEYVACATQTYQTASSILDEALADSSWTACMEQQPGHEKLPPAVILDVDETVLDNTAFEARLIKQNAEFDPDIWWPWCREAKAPPVPGSLTFLREAKAKGVAIFYVTNRSHEIKEATLENLQRFNFPDSDDPTHLLTKNEQEGWGSDKATRRAHVANTHRVVMLFGDNFNDFASRTRVPPEARVRSAERYHDMWGRKWFMLPNPDYGDWEGALWDFERPEADSTRLRIKYSRLNTLED